MFPDAMKRYSESSFRLLFPVGEIHANKNQGRAKEEPDGNLFAEQPPGKNDRGDGMEIDPVRSKDRADFADDPVPSEITEHRGDDTKEEKI